MKLIKTKRYVLVSMLALLASSSSGAENEKLLGILKKWDGKPLIPLCPRCESKPSSPSRRNQSTASLKSRSSAAARKSADPARSAPRARAKCWDKFDWASYRLTGRQVMNGTSNPEKLIKYLAPLAIYFQELTGFPASVFLAQVVHETTGGGSKNFNKNNGIAGLSCWKENRPAPHEINLELMPQPTGSLARLMPSIPRKLGAACVGNRGPGEGGGYIWTKNIQDSALIYFNLLLYKRDVRKSYSKLRTLVANRKNYTKATLRQHVIWNLGSYAEDKAYLRSIERTIVRHKLHQYDYLTLDVARSCTVKSNGPL